MSLLYFLFQLRKSWPLHRVIFPALEHNRIEFGGTAGWHFEHTPLLDQPNDIDVFDAREGLGTVREDLPHADGKHPHVALRGELAKVDGLGRHPLNRQLALACRVDGVVDLARQPEVGKLDTLVVDDKYVSCRDVSVHILFRLQIGDGAAQLVTVGEHCGHLDLLSIALQVVSQLSKFGQLHDNGQRVPITNADYFYYVGMIEMLHDL